MVPSAYIEIATKPTAATSWRARPASMANRTDATNSDNPKATNKAPAQSRAPAAWNGNPAMLVAIAATRAKTVILRSMWRS